MVSSGPVPRRKKKTLQQKIVQLASSRAKVVYKSLFPLWKKTLKKGTLTLGKYQRLFLRLLKRTLRYQVPKAQTYVQEQYRSLRQLIRHITLPAVPHFAPSSSRSKFLLKILDLVTDLQYGIISDVAIFFPPTERTITVRKSSGTIFAQPLLINTKYQASYYLQQVAQLLSRLNHRFSFSRRVRFSPSVHVHTVHSIVYDRTRRVFSSFGFQIALSVLVTVVIGSSAYGVYYFIFDDLPSPRDLVEKKQSLTTRILDRNGQILYRVYEDENRTLVPLASIPEHVVEATIAIEDQNFYDHWGFSVRGITRAAIANSQGKPIQGGSTITQQLVKNRLLSNERTIRRKLRELLLSVLVEGMYTKEEILEMYLNQVAYGGSTYGIEEAAQRYYGKSVTELSIAEAAMLAGLPQAPSIYSPFGSYPELAYQRQHEVLRRMVEEEFITPEEASAAEQEVLQYRADVIDIKAPHFVMFVRQLLAELYGEEMVNQGGLEVVTTLDLPLQEQTQNQVTAEIESLERLRINNGAALVTNPKTGEILAMVGSKDYFDFANDGQVNVTLRPRQPGSSIKPLTYAMALERGKNPLSLIDDSPITYHIAGSPPYAPKNYDGRYHGRVTLKQALASSYNIPAVKLLNEIGVSNYIEKAESMGISTWQDRSRFGLSLTLGGGEVLMADMAKLYGTFANNGYTVDLNPILEIRDAEGTILYQNKCASEGKDCRQAKTLDPRVAYQISEMLSDNRARTPAFGPQSVLHIPGQQVAVKTGTTNNLKDNWTIGYTNDRLVAVWVGNNDNTPMSYVASGITGASPIWNQIMLTLLDEQNPHAFARPDGFIKLAVCTTTGTLPCTGCPVVEEQYFLPGTEPTQACNANYFKPKQPITSNAPNRDRILEGAVAHN